MKSVATIAFATALFSAGTAVAQVPPDGGSSTDEESELDRLEREAETRELLLRIAEADLARRQALIDSVPASGLTGAVTPEAGAGEPEATVIAAVQTRRAAQTIVAAVDEVVGAGAAAGPAALGLVDDPSACVQRRDHRAPRPLPTGRTIVVAGNETPALSQWRQFNARRGALLRQLCAAAEASGDADREGALLPMGEGGLSAASGPIAAVQIAHAVFSYLASDYSIAGVTVSGITDEMLVSAILEAGRGRYAAPAHGEASDDAFAAFDAMLGQLDDARNRVEVLRRRCVARRREAAARVSAARAPNRAAVQAVETENLRDCDVIDAAVAAHTSFAGEYGGSAEAANRSAAVIHQLGLAQYLSGGAQVLMVTVHSSDGAAYTQENLWTHLGGMPYHISASVVVSWRLTDSSGMAVHGGVLPMYSEYTPLEDVPDLLD